MKFKRLFVAVLGVLLSGLSVRAETVLQVKIPDSGQFVPGNPVSVEVTITNTSRDLVGYNLDNFAITLDQANSDGIEVHPPVESEEDFYEVSTELDAGASHTEVFYLDQLLAVSKPGKYRLNIKVTLSCDRKPGKHVIETTDHSFVLNEMPEDDQKTGENLKAAAERVASDTDFQKLGQDVAYLMEFKDRRLVDTAESTYASGNEGVQVYMINAAPFNPGMEKSLLERFSRHTTDRKILDLIAMQEKNRQSAEMAKH